MDVDVVVVGAGVAGLAAAASELKAKRLSEHINIFYCIIFSSVNFLNFICNYLHTLLVSFSLSLDIHVFIVYFLRSPWPRKG